MSSYLLAEDRFRSLARLSHAITYLQWDQLVMMPAGGNKSRPEALAELHGLYHEKLTAPETRDVLEKAADEHLDDEQLCSLREMQRTYSRAACLSPQLVRAKSLAGSRCEHGWRSQRRTNDWNGFLENFIPLVELAREEAQVRQEAGPRRFSTPYEAMLDLYCTGDSFPAIQALFEVLKRELPPMLDRAGERTAAADTSTGNVAVADQMSLNRHLASLLGFDFESGRLDESSHPFSTGVRGDLRITTRFSGDSLLESLTATAHEVGHSLYENGLPPRWDGLPVGQAANLCLHESQSLLFEKLVFLSKPFIRFFAPAIQLKLPQCRKLSSAALWRAATRVRPGLIRLEADEISYPLHIILRFEIESELIDGAVEAKDIPELWDDKMQRYLGRSTAGNYRDGCLQDIHWTDGSFGYFPAYTMGALNAAQLFHAACRAEPNWQEEFAAGRLDFLHEWLQKQVWQVGSLKQAPEIMQAATGEPTNPEHFLKHLNERYIHGRY